MVPRRVLLAILGALVVVLSGCTDTDPSDAEPGDAPADQPEPDMVGDLLGRPAGVDVEPLADLTAPGTLEGVVYALDEGHPIEGANVFATCLRAELVPGFTQRSITNATGGFEVPAGGLTDCLQVTYEIKAPGFTLRVPLSSGPLVAGTATFVYGGLVQAPPGDAPAL